MTPMKEPEFMTQSGQLESAYRSVSPYATGEPGQRARTDCNRRKRSNGGEKKEMIQNFTYFAPKATCVRLAGDFTGWLERPINLRKGHSGLWWTGVRLERGTHYYRFLVDGQWRDDPDCPLVVPNPFGSLNAVRQVNW